MMLNDYPVKFDNETIPFPTGWDESPEVVENTYETEAGTDQVDVVRYDKMTISASFTTTSRWAKKFREYSKRDTIEVSYWDADVGNYNTRTMRIRGYKQTRNDNSRYTQGTEGIWNVSFNLNEF